MEQDRTSKVLDELLETLASVEHERWSHWQRYMHSKCIPHGDDGALLIPADLVKRWDRLIVTPYSELTDDEKRVIESRCASICRSLSGSLVKN